jgi:hypothetical protein
MDFSVRHSLVGTENGKKIIFTVFECKTCRRKFNEASIKKHEKNCAKISKLMHKPFNMKAIRCKENEEKLKNGDKNFNEWGGGFKPKSIFSAQEIQEKVNLINQYSNPILEYFTNFRLHRILHVNFATEILPMILV